MHELIYIFEISSFKIVPLLLRSSNIMIIWFDPSRTTVPRIMKLHWFDPQKAWTSCNFTPLLLFPSEKNQRVERAKLKFLEVIYLSLPVEKNRDNSWKTRLEEWNLFAADVNRSSLLKNYPTAIGAFAFVADKATYPFPLTQRLCGCCLLMSAI